MKFEFTIKIFSELLESFIKNDYSFVTVQEYFERQPDNGIMLRHDIDKKPHNALVLARIEHDFGIRGTYYFRIVNKSFNLDVMRSIFELGHEIGYHYEDLSMNNGNIKQALNSFEKNLERFRKYFDVKTICMHGSPISKFDNRNIWETNDYKKFGLIGEPYLDLDFEKVFYLTDTGRRWNAKSISVRDKVPHLENKPEFKNTQNIIRAIGSNKFPRLAMITIHPQRWTDNWMEWLLEFLFQNTKNSVKWLMNKVK
ncbi:MAG: hypothetical protein ACP5P3_04550 [Ignavibacteria bacterium]